MARAIVAGATGLVGSACLDAALAEPTFDRVTALVRRPLERQHEKLAILITDGRTIPPIHPMTGGAFFCAVGTTIAKAGSQEAFREVDFEIPVRLARAALEAGATRMAVVSSVGADPRASNFYLRVKGELEVELRRLPFESLHIFRPSLLMGERVESRPGEKIAMTLAPLISWALAGGLSKYHPIAATEVGRTMVKAVVRGSPGVHIYHYSEIRAL